MENNIIVTSTPHFANEQAMCQGLQFRIHHHQALDGLPEVDQAGPDSTSEPIKPLHLLHQHSVHALLVLNWVLRCGHFQVKHLRKLRKARKESELFSH